MFNEMTGKAPNRPIAGALNIIAASIMFAFMGALIKKASGSLNSGMVVFFRNSIALVLMLPALLRGRSVGGLKTGELGLHMVRSLSGLAAMYFYFYTLTKLPLAEAVLLSYTSPLFIPFVAYLWLNENVSKRLIAAMLIGFGGVVLIMKPGTGMFQAAAFFGLAAGAVASISMVSIRRMASTEPPFRIVFYYTLIATFASAFPLPWTWITPDPELWLVLLGLGVFACLGQLFVTRGYTLAPSAQIGPFTYSTVLFAAILGFIFWNEKLDFFTLGGGVLILIAGILAARKG
ncbi:DMT family transporter [Desulforegula conservatrix]|uniref:DMT family transporter n=1 Tax=Desulforegula conservatrix TaxID=153026 RepID=UPI000414F3F4|nr:DMT family transporter [Desulforegula conservatrix]